jgi:osmotically-inducible protein OsmY
MVTLSGTASSRQVAKRAEQLASQINGVKGVEDYIHYTNR